MGLTDIFKAKKGKTEPENKLEDLLIKSVNEPAYRPEFYKALLEEDLVILTETQLGAEGEKILKENTKIKVVALADGRIPVFTSVKRIHDRDEMKQNVNFIKLKGIDLFRIFDEQTTVILNPYSDFSKILLPDEIKKMRTGELLRPDKQINIQKETKIRIGQPAKYPNELVNSLSIYCSRRKEIRGAYLAQIQYSPNDKPHLLFGIDVENNADGIFNEVSEAIRPHIPQGDMVDFIKIDSKNNVSEYLTKQTKPVYLRG